VYSVGGITSNEVTPTGYAYDPGTQAWSALPAMKYARDDPQAAFIGGKLYVSGGWGTDQVPVAQTEVYDPARNAWSEGAPAPFPYGGASTAVLDGKLYVIGGCDQNVCGETTVQVYDPVTNTWSTAADYPEPIAWEGCGAIDGEIYCAGGTTSNSTLTGDAYRSPIMPGTATRCTPTGTAATRSGWTPATAR
jgi:N-acetylneuraminic acid mutarotase